MYKLSYDGDMIIRLSDNACIPARNNKNSDYIDYLKWVAEGNTPEPVDIEIVTKEEELRRAYQEAGCTTDALVMALWEKVVENRPEAADALQVLREQVKVQIK